jgi:hypothetical protein
MLARKVLYHLSHVLHFFFFLSSFFWYWGIELRTPCLLGKYSNTSATFPVLFRVLFTYLGDNRALCLIGRHSATWANVPIPFSSIFWDGSHFMPGSAWTMLHHSYWYFHCSTCRLSISLIDTSTCRHMPPCPAFSVVMEVSQTFAKAGLELWSSGSQVWATVFGSV